MPSSKSDCVLKVEIADIGVYLWNQNYFVKKIIIDTKCLKKNSCEPLLNGWAGDAAVTCSSSMGQLGRILVAAAHSSGQPWWWGSGTTTVCLSTRAARSCLARSWHKQCTGCETWITAQNWSEPPCTETAGVACLQVGSWISETFLSVSCVYTYWKMYFFLPPILASQWTFWCLHTIEYFKLHPSFFWCITTSLEVKKT